jgi:hypothetical protein
MSGIQKIYLDDLNEPVRNEVEQAYYDSGKPVEISVESILSAAKAATGLSDFGPMDFVERLQLWVDDINADKGLHTIGRQDAFEHLKIYAINRLNLENAIKLHPEILDVKIEKPLMIAGLPRSGTTHLVNMLATDPRLRSVQLWEATMPFPLPGEQRGPVEQNPRYLLIRELWSTFSKVLSHMNAIHPMDPDHVHESIEFQCADFSSYAIEWFARMPNAPRYYFEHDQTPHYAYEKKMMQALTWQRGPNRWLTKSPPYMENLIPLTTVFPDATVIITHRDPIAVIQSTLTLLAYWDRIRRTEQDLPWLANHWIWRIEMMLKAAVRDRDKLPEGQVVDVIFHEYMADQEGLVKRIYRTADLGLTPEADARIAAYREQNKRGKYGAVQYDLNQFGVNVGELRERFQFYYDRFPVQKEPARGEKL